MQNKSTPYRETHPLQLNAYLLFYVYIFIVLIIANVLPVSAATYFLFLFLGISAISILIIKFTYSISIKGNLLELSIKIPFKITLFNLKIEDIKSIEKTRPNPLSYFKKRLEGKIFYFFHKEDAIKLTMMNGKIFIVSGVNADRIVSLIKDYQKQ